MGIGINDLDDDDFGMGFEPTPQEPPAQEPPLQEPSYQEPQNQDDLVSDFLKTRGIDDISKIKFDDGNGNIEERSWNSLTKEEKINILNTPLTEPDDTQQNDLTDEEIQLLSQIRQSNLSPSKLGTKAELKSLIG